MTWLTEEKSYGLAFNRISRVRENYGMSTFYQCYYHIVWATKYRAPLISPEIELLIHQTIRDKSHEMECPLYALNGVEDHIHLAVTIPPKVAVAHYVQNLKGGTARSINLKFLDNPDPFRWQANYSVLTFGAKQLPFVVNYIQNQKTHHTNQILEPYLERTE
jgi:putative transposase